MTTLLTALIFLALINVVTFCLFWWDKVCARKGAWRIPEAHLLSLALVGGSLGALAAQQWLRHKTLKEPFRTRLLFILYLHFGLILAGFAAVLWFVAKDILRL